jgi:GNAT superfamily N-acetyltransferase
MKIVALTTENELRAAYPVMQELRPHLDEQTYLDRLRRMIPGGFRLYALFDEGQIMALAGVQPILNLSSGAHLFVHDLVTTAVARSRGYGRALLAYVEAQAREEGCDKVVLTSGLRRVDAHRFYDTHMAYDRSGYVFKKDV